MVDVGTDSAVTLSHGMYNSSVLVASTLIYGVQWDAALNFISKIDKQNREIHFHDIGVFLWK